MRFDLFNLFRCIFCGAKSQPDFDICVACEAQLPWMANIKHCQICSIDLPEASTESSCGNCLSKPPYFNQVHAALVYRQEAAFLLQKLKFQHQLIHSKIAGKLLVQALNGQAKPEILIPVPLHWHRQIQRGFNQSLEIARFVSKELNVPINNKLIKRHLATAAQSESTSKARLGNVSNAFTVKTKSVPKHVAIVDDVLTTGSTVNAMAKKLKAAGVQTIEIWCVARTLLSTDIFTSSFFEETGH